MSFQYPVPQTDPPRSPRETLPTMYDLPSEDPEEPGLPDEFHYRQPPLLSQTFQPKTYPPEQVFSAGDMNLYYDIRHFSWYKRPDWFGVVGVSKLYDDRDLRLSYVMWQEMVPPTVVVELLSPGTEREDLGRTTRLSTAPPTKWEVYEQILKVPYYIVFDRYSDRLRGFVLTAGFYQELQLAEPKIWIPQLELGLGLWAGEYEGMNRLWLRWYDGEGNWISTPAEQKAIVQEELETERRRTETERQRAETERQRAETERQRAETERERSRRLEELLRSHGIDPDL
ncbi:Uma2 family endonuclease [Lyngbya sp. CCY1209]|uniref:Uma2 family endonuclease n=1 Tax=Lyngbya sp. CCY1209 TaxID=2886103 RepID=UPI002D2018AF|nr:Uma2 family endonuclease [Lyngbya sp. CCY1209]MEB3882144.1 Uma2 family endonuclease [Lyngbya sp. CCY1209]